MKSKTLGLVLAMLVNPAFAELRPADGRVLLTLSGAITEANRGAATEDDVTILGALDLAFDRAGEFDAKGLAALGQAEIETNIPGKDTRAVFSGPRLSAVLDAVGATGQVVRPMALDGYAPEFPRDLITAHAPILATAMNGRPLGLGGLGPVMIVFPDQSDPDLDATLDAFEVWGLIHIAVE